MNTHIAVNPIIDYSHWFVRARLKTRQLLLIVAIADERNLHRAAEVLNIAQPAATKLLKDVEEALGVPLFDRGPRGMRANWYGETMVRHARIALANLTQAHDEIVEIRAGRVGQVNLGAITSPGLALLPIAVARVKREQPRLRVSVDIETSAILLERMEQGKLDVVVARISAEHDTSNLQYEVLNGETVCAVVRQGHPLATAEALSLRDIATEGWIVPPKNSVLRHRFELMYLEAGLQPPDNVIESAALLFVTAMVQRSDMIAVLAGDVAKYYESHGIASILQIEMPCNMESFGLITRTDRILSPGGKLIVEALRAARVGVYGGS